MCNIVVCSMKLIKHYLPRSLMLSVFSQFIINNFYILLHNIFIPITLLFSEVKSSCDIPAVIEGGNGTLSCQFGDDISKLQMRVKVVHYIGDRAGRNTNVIHTNKYTIHCMYWTNK